MARGATLAPVSWRREYGKYGLSSVLVSSGVALWMIKPVGDLRLVTIGYLLVSLGSLISAMGSALWIDAQLLRYWYFSVLVGAVGVLIGVINHNPGASSETVFFVALPATWLIIALGLELVAIQSIINIMPMMGMIIGVLGFCYWLDASHRLTIPWVFVVNLGQGYGSREFGSALRFYPISTLVFIVPFSLMSLLVKQTYSWRVSRLLALPASLCTICLMFVAGRRVLFVCLGLSLAYGLVSFPVRSPEGLSRTRAFSIAALLAIASVGLQQYTHFSFIRLLASLQTELDSSQSVRAQSGLDLLSSWSHAPLFGHGLGAIISGAPRSIDRPWDFELQYLLVLNAVGLIGFLVFTYITIGLFIRARTAVLNHYSQYGFVIPVFVGTVSLIIANATNPYMHTPGHYWMFYLLVISANAIYRDMYRWKHTAAADLSHGRQLLRGTGKPVNLPPPRAS